MKQIIKHLIVKVIDQTAQYFQELWYGPNSVSNLELKLRDLDKNFVKEQDKIIQRIIQEKSEGKWDHLKNIKIIPADWQAEHTKENIK
jgi:hypothetical protein